MKKFYFSVILLFVLISNSQAQWQKLSVPFSYNQGIAVDALGNNFAVILPQSNRILITTDTGVTWAQKILPADRAIDISIVNTNVFYVAFDNGSFYKTIDGGNTWTVIFSNPSLCSFGNYIEMFSDTKGIAMGDGPGPSFTQPVFLKTTNGNDWQQTCTQAVGSSGDMWRRMDFVDENVGYFFQSGINPQNILKTTNGGSTWTTLNNYSGYVQVLKFYDANYGLVYDGDNFYKTTDGGSSWQLSSTISPAGWGVDIEFLPGDKNKIWFTNITNIYYSGDGGATWLLQTPPAGVGGRFKDIVFTSDNVGWIFGDNGNLFYTNNNGGLLTSIESNNVLPNKFELFQNYPNPFNPTTVIGWQITVSGHVTLKVYDLLGREVTTLVNEFQQPGSHNSTFNINNYSLSSGTYFYRLTTGDFSSTQKMVLLK
ncbi:MAG: YCF48-related protein [Ignavibacteriales bacterium]|nr:YCF48-related protein [Ignavibacteriales bacterium]